MLRFKYYILAAIAALMITSCEEWEAMVVTQINSDGTCKRIITTSDEQCVDYGPEWEVTCETKTNGVVDSTMKSISRTFENVGEMAANPILTVYGERVKSDVSLTKRFKWFYTDFTYTETFPGWQDHFEIPVTDFMEEDNAEYMFTGYPEYLTKGKTGLEMVDYLDEQQKLYELWGYTNVLNCHFKTIANHYSDFSNPPVDKATFLSLRDSVARYGYEKDYDVFTDTRELLEDFFGSECYNIFFNGPRAIQDKYDDEMDSIFNSTFGICCLKMPYLLMMPGRITDTGRGSIEKNLQTDRDVIVYRMEGNFLVLGDYTITASSRVTNVWAFILSGVVILLALASLLIFPSKFS